MTSMAKYHAQHFLWEVRERVATLTFNRPERKNPITFDSYAEMRELFRSLQSADDVRVVVLTGAGGNFSSGGDVHEIIGPLTRMGPEGLLEFTQMTGDVVKAMRACPQPIIAAIDGICAGAGAALAMASDFRYGTPATRTAFLFTRVGLAGADMGACAMLPRIIGQGRASELLYTGRVMSAEEGLKWGFFNELLEPAQVLKRARAMALELASGPAFAHSVTKQQLHAEWNVGVDEALVMEARAQAICMQTQDFKRAYEAFVKKEKPRFEGN
jgi:enoyl-CoA hydratase/carnithine racemase